MKLVPDQAQRAAETKILEGRGLTVIEITSAPSAQAPTPKSRLAKNIGG